MEENSVVLSDEKLEAVGGGITSTYVRGEYLYTIKSGEWFKETEADVFYKTLQTLIEVPADTRVCCNRYFDLDGTYKLIGPTDKSIEQLLGMSPI